MKLCDEHSLPIVASGANTSLEGHTAALRGGVGISLRDMHNVLQACPLSPLPRLASP